MNTSKSVARLLTLIACVWSLQAVATHIDLTVRQQCTIADGNDFGFHPVGVGQSTIQLSTPATFSTPANLNQSITATVN
jgi:hypothetical protein